MNAKTRQTIRPQKNTDQAFSLYSTTSFMFFSLNYSKQDYAFAKGLHLLSQFYSIKSEITIGKIDLNLLEKQALGTV